MNRKVLGLLLCCIMAVTLVTWSCGGTSNGEQEEEEEEEDLTWGDIPIYLGARQVQKGAWSIPAEQGEWSNVEWRYYESDDNADDVASFYRAEMPDEGWNEIIWMEAEGVAWVYYTKNDEEDGAMFWVASEEGDTFFALMRASN